jgi:hypothetical protein
VYSVMVLLESLVVSSRHSHAALSAFALGTLGRDTSHLHCGTKSSNASVRLTVLTIQVVV